MSPIKTSSQRYSAKTHMGLVRPVNEDAILALPSLGLWAIADGMGGHQGGDFASQTVIDALSSLPEDLPPASLPGRIRDALHQAHRDIQAEAARRGSAIIGTTVVLLVVSGDHFLCLWAGDSRLYRLRGGMLEMISEDHSVVGELVAAGQLTWDQAEHHAQNNQITHAIGVGSVPGIEKRRGAIVPGDRFLLCSDGLTKYANEAMLKRIMQDAPLDTLADELMRVALAGGGADNISVIAVEV
ncbi:PP2C family serine/threonine-protein phosphatase [uncultured Tateyamaria sp.]|uniref:PP2C family protein-serine/threonine phosphatase n=1 Tax=uncultured Tateyamaria sp. TaxID=455651 RepID=UPI002623B7ED|nr:protein phosphatase 2C domain-containing protein [uncultured Tateyamaria sp.]